MYADIIHGKLDQKNSQLEVDYAIGRDIKADDVKVIVDCLQEWCSACEGVLACVESQIHRANTEKTKGVQRKAEIEQEVWFMNFFIVPFLLNCFQIVNIKKTLKAQLSERQDGQDDLVMTMATDSREATASGDKGKKPSKVKGIRSGGKFWLKS